MARKATESEQAIDNGTTVPILAEGIGTRIKAAADKIGSRKKAAGAAGVSDDMLYKYIRETSTPSFAAMAGLCRESGYSLDWMATGEGAARAGEVSASPAAPSSLGRPDIDLDALEEVVSKIRRMFRERNINLKPEAEARIVRLVYEYYLRQGEAMDEASLDNVIELAAFR